jgi:hypothetical protein
MVDHTDTTISGTSISYSMEEINTAKKNLSNYLRFFNAFSFGMSFTSIIFYIVLWNLVDEKYKITQLVFLIVSNLIFCLTQLSKIDRVYKLYLSLLLRYSHNKYTSIR